MKTNTLTTETGSRHARVNSIHSSDKSHKHIGVNLRLLVYQFLWRSVWSSYHSKTTRTNRGSWRGFWRVFGRPRLESRPKFRLSSPKFVLVFLRPLPLKSFHLLSTNHRTLPAVLYRSPTLVPLILIVNVCNSVAVGSNEHWNGRVARFEVLTAVCWRFSSPSHPSMLRRRWCRDQPR